MRKYQWQQGIEGPKHEGKKEGMKENKSSEKGINL